jgi:hypothetical protein
LELGRCLNWKISCFIAPENAIDIAGRASELVGAIRSVRDQAAADDIGAIGINRR